MISLLHSLPLACATCFAKGDDATTYAAGVAVLFMLVVLFCMLGALLKFMHYLARCERAAITPEAQLMGIDPRVAPVSTQSQGNDPGSRRSS